MFRNNSLLINSLSPELGIFNYKDAGEGLIPSSCVFANSVTAMCICIQSLLHQLRPDPKLMGINENLSTDFRGFGLGIPVAMCILYFMKQMRSILT